MKILMVTNTFSPHVGGVARSVQAFSDRFRALGHPVLVIAPHMEGVAAEEEGVLRIPALQDVSGSTFSLAVPLPGMLAPALDRFEPQIVHAHHPFLLGGTALRIATARRLPIVFTHHTRYEAYTHYLPFDSLLFQRFVMELASGFANLCDHVIAPSQSVAEDLRERGVQTPIVVLPTGVEVDEFAAGDATRVRSRCDISDDALVVGHVGRLAPEKNLAFLATVVAKFLAQRLSAHFMVAGDGPASDEIARRCAELHVDDRCHFLGSLHGADLADAYAAMDVFAFASQSETQGMVLTEAMAAGVPVVAVDASGVRDVVVDGVNGRLLPDENAEQFIAALEWFFRLPRSERERLREGARRTAEEFSMSRSAEQMLSVYDTLVARGSVEHPADQSAWTTALGWIEGEIKLLSNAAGAVGTALTST